MIARAMGMMGAIGIMLASSGCTMEWVKMDAGARSFGPAHSSCRAQADDHWPVRNEVATRTVYEDRKVPCSLMKSAPLTASTTWYPCRKRRVTSWTSTRPTAAASSMPVWPVPAGSSSSSGSIAARRSRRGGRQRLDRLLLNGLEATVASGECRGRANRSGVEV